MKKSILLLSLMLSLLIIPKTSAIGYNSAFLNQQPLVIFNSDKTEQIDISTSYLSLLTKNITDETMKADIYNIVSKHKRLLILFSNPNNNYSSVYLYAIGENSPLDMQLIGENNGSWKIDYSQSFNLDDCVNGLCYSKDLEYVQLSGTYSYNSQKNEDEFTLANPVLIDDEIIQYSPYIQFLTFIADLPVTYPTEFNSEPFKDSYIVKPEILPDYHIQTVGDNITISLDQSTLPSELDKDKLGYEVTIQKLNDDLSQTDPLEHFITTVQNLDLTFTQTYPLSKYRISVKFIDKENLYSSTYIFKDKSLVFDHNGTDKFISSADYDPDLGGDIAHDLTLNPNSFKNLIKISFSNPFKPLFDLFKTGNTCVNVPIIAGMLKAPNSTYCSWFSSSTRDIVTPVIQISSLMLIFGYFIRWLSGHSGDNTINLGDQYTGFFGRRFK